VGSASAAIGRHREAAEAYSAAVRAEPAFTLAWNNLGDALLALGRPDDAAEALRRAAALDPGLAVVRVNLGRALEAVATSTGPSFSTARPCAWPPASPRSGCCSAQRCGGRADERLSSDPAGGRRGFGPAGRVTRWPWALAPLLLLTLAAFSPVLTAGFINVDDPLYVLDNPMVSRGLSAASLRWALGAFHFGTWQPLAWLSHMLDASLFGLQPRGHHLTSLLLHAANAGLLLLVLSRMTGLLWPSLAVASLFALHPLRVESVAWVAERKDVLAGLFWLLAMAAYLRYVRRPSAGRYAAASLAFALGLAAKPMLVTLPRSCCSATTGRWAGSGCRRWVFPPRAAHAPRDRCSSKNCRCSRCRCSRAWRP